MCSLNTFNTFSVFLLCLVTTAWLDIDISLPEDIRDKITCEKLDESDCRGGYIKKVASLSGCEVCVKYANINEKCDGTEVRVECKGGLECDAEGVCAKYTKCESDLMFKESMMKNGKISKKSWLLKCTPGGVYNKIQITDSKAICVDDNGRRIFGQEQKEFAENMTCECSYYLSKKKEREKTAWANGPIERCTPSGDYDSLQCVDDICYCADPSTGKPIGLVTHIKYWKMLTCYDSARHGYSYGTNCEKEMFRINSLKHQFAKKGIQITGINFADCDPDGTFSPKQCLTNICYCVDENGFSFDSYKEKKDLSQNMDCRCARDKYLIQSHHLQYPDLMCDGNGNYFPLQHVEDEYFCCDGEGSMIVEYENRKPDIEEMIENCKGVLQTLREKIGVAQRR